MYLHCGGFNSQLCQVESSDWVNNVLCLCVREGGENYSTAITLTRGLIDGETGLLFAVVVYDESVAVLLDAGHSHTQITCCNIQCHTCQPVLVYVHIN